MLETRQYKLTSHPTRSNVEQEVRNCREFGRAWGAEKPGTELDSGLCGASDSSVRMVFPSNRQQPNARHEQGWEDKSTNLKQINLYLSGLRYAVLMPCSECVPDYFLTIILGSYNTFAAVPSSSLAAASAMVVSIASTSSSFTTSCAISPTPTWSSFVNFRSTRIAGGSSLPVTRV